MCWQLYLKCKDLFCAIGDESYFSYLHGWVFSKKENECDLLKNTQYVLAGSCKQSLKWITQKKTSKKSNINFSAKNWNTPNVPEIRCIEESCSLIRVDAYKEGGERRKCVKN